MVASSSGRSPRHWPDFSSVSTRSLFPAPESRAARRCHGLGRLRHRRWGHTKSGWLFTTGLVLHGWLPTALDVFFYGYLLAWILVHSRNQRAGGRFHGGMVRGCSAVAACGAAASVGCSNQAPRSVWTGSCAPCIAITSARAHG